MKKIIAIATAFVMTLTMTSALASFNWTTPTVNRTGKATVEVIPYAKAADGAGGFVWKPTEYAAAISSERVYFAVKLTVAANPDPLWLENASLSLEGTGFAGDWANEAYSAIPLTGVDSEASAKAVYYLTRESADSSAAAVRPWSRITDSFSVVEDVEARDSLCIFSATVYNSNKAKLCAALTSSFGMGDPDFTAGKVGKYYVTYDQSALSIYRDEASAAEEGAPLVRYTVDPATERVSSVTNSAGSAAPYDYASIRSYFNIDVGTRITQKLINANFGWSDRVEDCFKWGGRVAPTPEADTSIPKTGGASLTGYALLTTAAAAGILLKKR